ncbi:hypothetical protein BVRB_037460, partial [Beta vulgaris subsp. vulgaris]
MNNRKLNRHHVFKHPNNPPLPRGIWVPKKLLSSPAQYCQFISSRLPTRSPQPVVQNLRHRLSPWRH